MCIFFIHVFYCVYVFYACVLLCITVSMLWIGMHINKWVVCVCTCVFLYGFVCMSLWVCLCVFNCACMHVFVCLTLCVCVCVCVQMAVVRRPRWRLLEASWWATSRCSRGRSPLREGRSLVPRGMGTWMRGRSLACCCTSLRATSRKTWDIS